MYPYILFDLDGTLTDPGEGITRSVEYALSQFGIAVENRRKLYSFIGPPLLESFAKYYGFNKQQAQRALKEYRVYFCKQGMFENELYPQTGWLLQELCRAGAKLILATSKPEPYAERILEHFNIRRYFHCVAGASMDEVRCEKSDVITYAMEKAGVPSAHNAIMVGDRAQDVLGAHACGLPAVGVLWGYGDRAELQTAGAEHLVQDMGALCTLLLQFPQKKGADHDR